MNMTYRHIIFTVRNSALFHIKYDGSALASHEMDVKDLAPALLSVGELFEEANRILNRDSRQVSVNLRATETGCVDVVLSVTQDVVSEMTQLFSSDGASAVANAAQILAFLGIGGGGGILGVIGLIKWIKGRDIETITTLEDGDYKLILKGGEARVVKKQEIELFKAFKVRKSIETIVQSPLKRQGIESVSFIDDNKKETLVTKDEADYFVSPPAEEEMIDERDIEQTLQLVNISFQDGGKWRFSDGNATFYADILDSKFLAKVSHNQAAFAKDDILKVRMKRRQSVVSGAIKTDYTILEIMEHKSAAVTIKLPFA